MAISTGSNINSVPNPIKQKSVTDGNYIDFSASGNAWAQQFLPDLMEKEAEVFGNRTVSGFLEMVGAEEPSTADRVAWSEQGRLHLKYTAILKNHVATANDGDHANNATIDDLPTTCALRTGDMVLVSSAAKNATVPAYVKVGHGTSAGGASTEAQLVPYGGADASVGLGEALGWANGAGSGDPLVIVVVGSEYKKGALGRDEEIQPEFKSFFNKMMIMKDKYMVSGSDASQIGWVEVSGEDGQNGYLWYLKAAGDTKTRFADYCEMAMLEAKTMVETNTVAAGIGGSEGLFAAIVDRGIMTDGLDATGASPASDNMDEFDLILKEFDKQGAIEEYMMFLNRDTSLAIDDMLAEQNSYGAGGTSYGVFDNSEDMALNLGFSGFRRGSYDFYKSDWKYLNDSQTRGAITVADNSNVIRGCFVPAGVTSVYDQMLGRNLKRPFLHVRYRASQTDDRRFKTWTTGSVGAATSDLDAMEMHFLTERCLIVQGANNFCLIKG
jgi:hypothetical protein|tara:strand:+ start:537 stop:2027 length:1491 start_codon:yes stop_codon:yes gene_type:complete